MKDHASLFFWLLLGRTADARRVRRCPDVWRRLAQHSIVIVCCTHFSALLLRKTGARCDMFNSDNLTIYHVLQQEPQTSKAMSVCARAIRGISPDPAVVIVSKTAFLFFFVFLPRRLF